MVSPVAESETPKSDQTPVEGVHADSESIAVAPRKSSARTLLKYAGKWSGNDLAELTREVIAARSEAVF